MMSGGIRRPRRTSSAPAALRAAQLVGRDAEQVRPEPGEVQRDVPRARARVDVHQDVTGPRRRAGLGDRLHGADLVVRELDGDEDGLVRDRRSDLVRVEATESVHPDDRELTRFATACVQHTGVLDGGRDDRAAEPTPSNAAPDRVVDRLGAARREHDLPRSRAEERRDLLSCVLDRDPGDPSLGVQTGGIAVVLREEREHGLERRRAQRGRGRVIEVRAGHD